ncbi:hypothetical protein GOBAR_DD07312 [Gossypium barbadense]|nr:hypothetical protein GOBAR_DD07312 [Gossypium barbadense]
MIKLKTVTMRKEVIMAVVIREVMGVVQRVIRLGPVIAKGIHVQNFTYEFSKVHNKCKLSDSSNEILLPIYLFEDGQPVDNEAAEEQLNCLKSSRSLVLDMLIIVRNVFCFCLENQSPNRYRLTNVVVGINFQ